MAAACCPGAVPGGLVSRVPCRDAGDAAARYVTSVQQRPGERPVVIGQRLGRRVDHARGIVVHRGDRHDGEVPVEPLWLNPQPGDPGCQGKHEGYPLAVLPGQPGTGLLQAVRIRAVTPVRGHDLERGQHPAACRVGEAGREIDVPVGAHRAAASGDPAEHLRARPLPAVDLHHQQPRPEVPDGHFRLINRRHPDFSQGRAAGARQVTAEAPDDPAGISRSHERHARPVTEHCGLNPLERADFIRRHLPHFFPSRWRRAQKYHRKRARFRLHG